MRTMILNEVGRIEENPLQLTEIPEPQPEPDEILVRIKACGICHTDLHIVEGEIPLHRKPIIPGHQIVGSIEKIGDKVSRFKPGERVGVAWLYSTCGNCPYCQSGKENLCEKATFTGYDVDGGYGEYATVSEDFAYPLPEEAQELEIAPLLCAGIIGYRALRLSEIKKGQILGLYGFGASAHLAIQVANFWNCQVYVFTRSRRHQELAKKLGAVWTGEAGDSPPKKLDSAIIFAPAGELVPQALKVLRKGGTLALAGIFMTAVPQMDYTEHLYFEKTIRNVTASTRRDGQELLKLAVEIPIKTEIQIFPLEEANRALQLLKEGKINGAGVLKI